MGCDRIFMHECRFFKPCITICDIFFTFVLKTDHLMSAKKSYLVVLLGVQWLLVVIIFIITFFQFYYGFNFNYFMFVPLLMVVVYKIWMIRFDYAARKKLEKTNKDFHDLGRTGRRKILYEKGIKKHIK